MNESALMHDLVILLPGIGGSSLYQGKNAIWDVSAGAMWPLFLDRQLLNDTLSLPSNPLMASYLPRVHPQALITGIHGIFGLAKVDGYGVISKLVTENFQVTRGDVHAPAEDQNFFEFPYDWRQSNADSAAALKAFIDHQLPAWRAWSRWKNARVILLAHSMGGLVSRYYLEVLGGWRQCRSLITFGTPFRGSVDALAYLANGFSKLDFDLSQAMRTMPSLYELLPIYPVLKVGTKWLRVAEIESFPATLDRRRVRAGLAFHRAIERKVRLNMRNEEYRKHGYLAFSIVGVEQPTLQSAELHGGVLTTSRSPPPFVDASIRGGDGRVPRVSATPIEHVHNTHALHCVECHGSLQSNRYVLDDLKARLQQLQVNPALPPVRGSADQALAPTSAISLSVGDLYLATEEVQLQAWYTGPAACTPQLHARIYGTDGSEVAHGQFRIDTDGLTVCLTPLPPGAYRIAVTAESTLVGAPPPVHDVFEVAESTLRPSQ